MMKSVAAVEDRKPMVTGGRLRVLALALMLCAAALLSTGCRGMGETRAEASRRHSRVLRLDTQELGSDIDLVLMLDRPSRLTDRRLP
jgi:hypothetical protein